MNVYQVHFTAYTETSRDVEIHGSCLHVAAISRERAVYAAFDELADQGLTVETITAVFILQDNVWMLIAPHTPLTPTQRALQEKIP